MSNGNSSFTYVQNVNSADIQEVNAGSITAANVVASSVLVIPQTAKNPNGNISGVPGQVLVKLDPTDNLDPTLYVCYGGKIWQAL